MYEQQTEKKRPAWANSRPNLGRPSGLPRNATNNQIATNVLNRMGLNEKQIGKLMPSLIQTRPPVIANKARGTQSSSTYRPMPNALGPSMMF